MIIRPGDRGDAVKKLQAIMGITPIDGIYGRITEAAVKNFQLKNNLPATGIVDPDTGNLLFTESPSTDLSEKYYVPMEGLVIKRQYLSKDEYFSKAVFLPKKYIVLHHTAGNENPYDTIRDWETDDRGRVGTQFVIGGKGLKGGTKYDGVILEAFPDGYWAGHLGGVPPTLHKFSIGIELCNWGWLSKKGDKYYTYTEKEVPLDQVSELTSEFRGKKYFHKYSEAQLLSLKKLLIYLGKKYQIDLKNGLQSWVKALPPEYAFEYVPNAYVGAISGILSHTTVQKTGKWDVYPSQELITMLLSL